MATFGATFAFLFTQRARLVIPVRAILVSCWDVVVHFGGYGWFGNRFNSGRLGRLESWPVTTPVLAKSAGDGAVIFDVRELVVDTIDTPVLIEGFRTRVAT